MLYTGMPRLSVSPNTISLSSDYSVATVDTFITNIGRSKNSECSTLGKSISLPARAVTDSVTGRSNNSECSPLGKSVSLPARAVTDSATGRPKSSECSPLGNSVSLPCRHRLRDRSVKKF